MVELEEGFLKELNERQRKAVEYLIKNGKITRREYGKLCKASERTANRELRGLVEKGIVKRRGSGVKFYYELAS